MENNFVYVKHDSIKPRQHCNYGGVHLNTAGSKILAENFILALTRQTWLGIIQGNYVLIENGSETESKSEIAKYLPEDSLESKSDNHDNDENISFPLLKKIKSEHPKNLILITWTIKCEFNQKQETLRVVTLTMICTTFASLWKFQYFWRSIHNPVEHLWWSFYCKNIEPLSIFTKKLHHRCLLGF